jgi:hypothetical protein
MSDEKDEQFIEMREVLKDLRVLISHREFHKCPKKGLFGQIRYCAVCNIRKYIGDLLKRTRGNARVD